MRDGESRSGTGPDPRPTRRGVLVGVSLAGLGGALASCSTAAVPYDANEAGVAPNTPTQSAGSASGAGSGAMSSSSPMPTSAGTPGGGMNSSQAPSGGAQAQKAKKKAKVTGTVLGPATEIPVGGGKIYTAAKVVVTRPSHGQYKAFSAVCTHVGCIMSKVADGTIDCPCHGSEFKITNGAVVTGPAPRPLPAKKIKIVSGQVILL
jgi:Rieske Fe-S protein